MSETIVIKLGGAEGVQFEPICKDVAALIEQGKRVVLVHGGSNEANLLGEAVGSPPKFITSPSGYTSRYTNLETMEIFCMALNGKINTFLVQALQKMGINAFGLCGLDGRLIQAKRKGAIKSIENGKIRLIRDDYTGKIDNINTDILNTLLDMNYVPVVAPIAISHESDALNVDADRAAAMIAAALQADQLLLLTAVPGIMKNFPDPSSLIEKVAYVEIENVLNLVEGRMKKKVLGAQEALDGGVGQVIIADGSTLDAPVINAIAGHGTSFTK
ncbi:MAG: [LysW]-aminoadipate kinase [Anaerolineaceae bacterium]|nr:[LysW]-aminoadipate kinase [Anaerolineaceae bacterium]